MPLSSQMKRFTRNYWGAVGTPLSAELLTRLDSEDWDFIASRRIDPTGYTCARTYFLDASAASLFRKCGGLPTTFDRKAAAMLSWRSGEVSCAKANIRLSPHLPSGIRLEEHEAVHKHLLGIRKIVRAVLGRAPEVWGLVGRHGPGATATDKSVRSTVADKMNSVPSMTPGVLAFLPSWLETSWGRACAASSPRRDPSIVRGNRFTTAPKDSMKDRPIAAEPSINVFFQLSLGAEIRRRLKNVGIDLDNGQSTHRRVACESSITGRLATIDLSNASDTLCYNLVRLLVPHDWFELLTALRSPFTEVEGKWVRLEKFSSMGNGFTFELESLIFYAIVKYTEMCLVDDDSGVTLVYGDDIICNSEIVKPLFKILNFLGFKINEEKSFWSGPFRESCGGDFFAGQAVRPYFMKELPCEPQHFIAAANGVRKAISTHFGGLGSFTPAWFSILDQLPTQIRRCRGPEDLGDLVIWDEPERWETRWRSQIKYVRVYRPARVLNKVSMHLFDYDVQYACALYGVPEAGGFITPREPVLGYKVGWMVAYGKKLPEAFLRRQPCGWFSSVSFPPPAKARILRRVKKEPPLDYTSGLQA